MVAREVCWYEVLSPPFLLTWQNGRIKQKPKLGSPKLGRTTPARPRFYKDMKKIIYTNNKAYQVIRVIREDKLKNPDISVLKEWFMCDTLLKNQGKLYFCRLIEEIEYEESDNI